MSNQTLRTSNRSQSTPFHSLSDLASSLLLVMLLALGMTPAMAKEPPPNEAVATVNINVADAETLSDGLSGVGDSRARDIVRYREEFGPFTTKEQLTEVKGIGMSTLDKNRAVITLD